MRDEDVTRLSPIRKHINVLGHYFFELPTSVPATDTDRPALQRSEAARSGLQERGNETGHFATGDRSRETAVSVAQHGGNGESDSTIPRLAITLCSVNSG